MAIAFNGVPLWSDFLNSGKNVLRRWKFVHSHKTWVCFSFYQSVMRDDPRAIARYNSLCYIRMENEPGAYKIIVGSASYATYTYGFIIIMLNTNAALKLVVNYWICSFALYELVICFHESFQIIFLLDGCLIVRVVPHNMRCAAFCCTIEAQLALPFASPCTILSASIF